MNSRVLYTRRFREEFVRCLSRFPRALKVVSPYIGKVPPYGSVVQLADFLFNRNCESFEIVTLPPIVKGGLDHGGGALHIMEADIIARKGVNLLIRPRLHSKVYQFLFPNGERASFIGSANFTEGGFQRNDETVAFFHESMEDSDVAAREFNDDVARELDRLSGSGALVYHFWKTRLNSNSKEVHHVEP